MWKQKKSEVPPSGEVHDERVDDWLYSYGWTQVSSQDACRFSGCDCASTGICTQEMFNHYMIESGEVSPLAPPDPRISQDGEEPSAGRNSPSTFPVYLGIDTIEMAGVEEVRCRPHVVNVAHAYYKANVVKYRRNSTLVSVAMGGYKSTCFNMSCYLLSMPRSAVPKGSLAMGSSSSEEYWVLARGAQLTALFLESLCTIGVDPVVEATGQITLSPQGPTEDCTERCFETAGFLWKRGGPNILWNPNMLSLPATCHGNVWGVRAVKTALVTVSVLLTPKSMYGGKNPTTKTIDYFVHNICHGKDV
jgi:hypothetical protein